MTSSRIVTRTRSVLAVLMIVSLVLIGQKLSVTLYAAGVLLAVVVVVLGFTFNNIDEEHSAREVLAPLLATWAIVAVIFGLAYFLAPVLTKIGA